MMKAIRTSNGITCCSEGNVWTMEMLVQQVGRSWNSVAAALLNGVCSAFPKVVSLSTILCRKLKFCRVYALFERQVCNCKTKTVLSQQFANMWPSKVFPFLFLKCSGNILRSLKVCQLLPSCCMKCY